MRRWPRLLKLQNGVMAAGVIGDSDICQRLSFLFEIAGGPDMPVEGIPEGLQSRPADFFVRENYLIELVEKESAAYRYMLLRKCGITTMEAVALVANAAGILPSDISYS